MKTAKCSKLSAQSNNKVKSISDQPNLIKTQLLYTFFIKTAYNCCCIGNFKNDYVDTCALKNCASYGVRALDFQIYSLNNAPIVSASSVKSTQYKEIYNHLSFYSVMKSVRQYFVDDSTNINRTDPLFLIFTIIMLAIVFIVGGYLSNTYDDFIADDTYAGIETQYPISHFLISNILIVILVVGFSVGVVLYGKQR
jgi:hypothetical protein